MCTVSFLPTKGGYILTHNRDEHFSRSPMGLTLEEIAGKKVIFPKDKRAGGSWIGISEFGTIGCVLNGAFTDHTRKPPYRRSRGLVLLDFFENEELLSFAQQYDFEGIEPFTFISVEAGQPYEIKWDEKEVHISILDDNSPHFWSSATLYPKEIHNQRMKFFQNWLALKRSYDFDDVLHLHYHGGIGVPKYDFVMNREGKVQTVSVTQVVSDAKTLEIKYHDLISNKKSEAKFDVRPLST